MVNTYNLVNPYVKGKFNTKTKAKNSLEAAKKYITDYQNILIITYLNFIFLFKKVNLEMVNYIILLLKKIKTVKMFNFQLNLTLLKT